MVFCCFVVVMISSQSRIENNLVSIFMFDVKRIIVNGIFGIRYEQKEE